MALRLAIAMVLLGLAAAPARAQSGAEGATEALATPVAPSEASEELSHARRGRPDVGIGEDFAAWLDFSLFGGPYRTGSISVLGTALGARMGIERIARLSLDWGFAYALASVNGTYPTEPEPLVYDGTVERVEAQNPVIALDIAPWLGTDARLSIGLLVAIPAAAIQTFGDANQAGPRTPAEAAIYDASRTTHEVWMAMNGAFNAWRYQPERVAVALPLALLIDAGPLEVALEGALGVSVPVLGGEGVTDAIAQAAADLYGTPLRFGSGNALTLGARLAIAGYHLGASTAAAQPSLQPWLRLDLRPAFLTVRGVLDVGDPFGLGTPTGVWAVHVGGGIATN